MADLCEDVVSEELEAKMKLKVAEIERRKEAREENKHKVPTGYVRNTIVENTI